MLFSELKQVQSTLFMYSEIVHIVIPFYNAKRKSYCTIEYATIHCENTYIHLRMFTVLEYDRYV